MKTSTQSPEFTFDPTLSRSIIKRNDEIIAKNKILLQSLNDSLERTYQAIDRLNALYPF